MSAPLARRELRQRPGRFLWLTVAVTVAVAFTVGAFGFSTQLSTLLDPAVNGVSDLDLLPQGSIVITPADDAVTTATALDDELLQRVRAVPGVALAEGSYDQPIAFRLPRGAQPDRPVILRGVVLSSTYSPERWVIDQGRAPVGPNELMVDPAGAIVGETALGAFTTLELPTGARGMAVVGVGHLVSAPAHGAVVNRSDAAIVALGAAHAVLDPGVAPILLDAAGRVDRITVLPRPGTDPGALEGRLRQALPPGVAVMSSLDRDAVTQHTVAAIDDGVRTAVAAFAGLTVLISSLVVANTLSVLVAQRTREFGLLRLVGASRAQVLRMVLGESMAVGLIGAVAGLGLGIVLAALAARVVRDSTVPVGFAVTPTMGAVAVAVGVGVTVVGGLVPAVRAGRIAPLAALSDTRGGADRRPRFLAPLLALVVGAGVAVVAAGRPGGMEGVRGAALLSGVLAAFIGIAGLSRWLVGPVLGLVGGVVADVVGAAGRLGVGNARRQPSRTAGAASTLMVGLALVGLVATVGASVRATVSSQFDTASRADLYLERRGVVRVSGSALAEMLSRRLNHRRSFAEVVEVMAADGVLVSASGDTSDTSIADLGALADLVDLGLTAGRIRVRPDDGAGGGGRVDVILSESAAGDLSATVGDQLRLRSVSGVETPLRVSAVYANTAIAGSAVVDLAPALDPRSVGTFELGLVHFVGHHHARAVAEAAGRFPKVRVHTPTEFGRLNASVTDTVLRIIGVVLAGMIGIGYLGLVATLALSTLERRRELVMLRAVGAARAQVRILIATEAVLVALIAAVVGLTVGVGAGWASGTLASDDLVASVVVPWGLLTTVGATSLVLAAVVSLGVARRASLVPPAEAGR